MAGADPAPHSLSQSTLIVIDAQNEYVDGALKLTGVEPALAEIARLLERARKAGTPVIHVQHKGRAGGLFDVAAHNGAIADQAAPEDGEPVVQKALPNAFAGTELDKALAAAGRKTLIIAGFMTHMCVSATARSALDHGFASTVVASACATRDLPDALGGGALKADAIHRAALTELSDRFATIARTAADLPD